MPSLKRTITCALLLGLSLGPRQAAAQQSDAATRAAARELGGEGVELYQRGELAPAAERLERAYRALKAPTLGLWLARALAKQGKLLQASEQYLDVTRLEPSGGDVALQKQAQTEALNERNALLPRIPALVISVEGAKPEDIAVTIDGTAVPSALLGARRPLDVGEHDVRAIAPGLQARVTVSVAEGETKPVTLKLEKSSEGQTTLAPARPAAVNHSPPVDRAVGRSSSVQPTVGWVLVGVGAAGVLTGGVAGIVAISKKSSLGDDCRENQCPPAVHGEVDTFNSLRTVSSIGFIAGAALAGTGVVLILTAPKQHEQAAWVQPYIGAGSLGVNGVF